MTMYQDSFDLVSLRLFVAIGKRSSIGRVARDVGLSQPSASLRLSEFERTVGVALVERSPSGSRLTEEGMAVADRTRRVVAAADAFARRAVTARRSL
jgi:molybdate transport repressor ModE-like protein